MKGRPQGKTEFKGLIEKHEIKDKEIAEWLSLSHANYLSSSARERYRNLVKNVIRRVEKSLSDAINRKLN